MIVDNLKHIANGLLRRIHATGWIGVASLFIAGVAGWLSFDFVMEETNTEQFCISCH